MGPPHVIASTGWTAINLLAAIKEEPLREKYDFVILLIGVNNQYVKRSLPDWSVTPFGKLKKTKLKSASVDVYNTVNREELKNPSVHFVDITADSRIAN
ncbi:MAG: hypothetical protein H7069_05615 [Phormidesmis sp. FL-bin-119]|nr:hypothetical protein [Pedobacter sp.]